MDLNDNTKITPNSTKKEITDIIQREVRKDLIKMDLKIGTYDLNKNHDHFLKLYNDLIAENKK